MGAEYYQLIASSLNSMNPEKLIDTWFLGLFDRQICLVSRELVFNTMERYLIALNLRRVFHCHRTWKILEKQLMPIASLILVLRQTVSEVNFV